MTIVGSGSEDAWQRECLIEVTDGTTHLALHSLIETVDIDIGEKELDVINLVNLGQLTKHGSIGLTTVTFEGYAKEAGTAATGAQTATGFWDMFAVKPGTDTSEPQEITITPQRNKMRVAIMWTDEITETIASGAVANTSKAYRFILAECFCTSCKYSFTDGILKTTLAFKGAAFDKSGNGTMQIESIDAGESGTFAALNTYVPGTSASYF